MSNYPYSFRLQRKNYSKIDGLGRNSRVDVAKLLEGFKLQYDKISRKIDKIFERVGRINFKVR